MPPAKGEAEGKDAFVAKAAGVAVVSGIAWSIYKSVTTAAKKEAPPPALAPPKGNLGGDGYEVSKGDTLFAISQRCGVSVEALRAANGVQGDDIYAGERLVIPK